MKREKIFIFIVMILIFSSIGIFAFEPISKDFNKGWNLISIDYIDSIFETGELKYLYILDSNSQEYFGGIISNDGSKIESILKSKINNNDFYFSSFVYLDNDVENVISSDMKVGFQTSIESIELFNGWNLISVNSQMIKKDIKEFQGDCVIEGIYFFDSNNQNWFELDSKNDDIDTIMLGLGLAVKVSEDCSFDFTESSNVPPLPSLSNLDLICSDSDGGENYELKGVVEFGSSSASDWCQSEIQLKEYICETNLDNGVEDVEEIEYICPNKCEAGACI